MCVYVFAIYIKPLWQVNEIYPDGRHRPAYLIVNTMAADDLATQVARASAAMVLT